MISHVLGRFPHALHDAVDCRPEVGDFPGRLANEVVTRDLPVAADQPLSNISHMRAFVVKAVDELQTLAYLVIVRVHVVLLLSVVEAQSFGGAAQSGGDTHSVRNVRRIIGAHRRGIRDRTGSGGGAIESGVLSPPLLGNHPSQSGHPAFENGVCERDGVLDNFVELLG